MKQKVNSAENFFFSKNVSMEKCTFPGLLRHPEVSSHRLQQSRLTKPFSSQAQVDFPRYLTFTFKSQQSSIGSVFQSSPIYYLVEFLLLISLNMDYCNTKHFGHHIFLRSCPSRTIFKIICITCNYSVTKRSKS